MISSSSASRCSISRSSSGMSSARTALRRRNGRACRASSAACCGACGRSRLSPCRIAGPKRMSLGIVARRHPQAQDVGAGLVFITSCGESDVALRLRHLLLALLVEDEAVREHDVEGRAAARAAAFQQRGLEPAAMLVGAFEVHDRVRRRRACADAGELGNCSGSSSVKACVEPESNHTSSMSSTCSHSAAGRHEALQKALLARPPRTRRRRPSRRRPRRCARSARSTWRSPDGSTSLGLVVAEDGDRHAPGALARHHPVGLGLDHAGDAVLPGRRHPLGFLDGARARSRRVCRCARHSPAGAGRRCASGLSIAMNHCGVLRKITGFLERQECGY